MLKYLYSSKSEFIICADININYLNENKQEQQINSLLKTYNLSHTVSSIATDNIFIDRAKLSSSYTSNIINGPSDLNAQLLTINDVATEVNLAPLKWRLRKINNETIVQFQRLLENGTWEPFFKNRDTKYKFHSFSYTFLKIFEASYPGQNKSVGKIRNEGITQGIKISCRHKRSIYRVGGK
jgi:hypothetical protein